MAGAAGAKLLSPPVTSCSLSLGATMHWSAGKGTSAPNLLHAVTPDDILNGERYGGYLVPRQAAELSAIEVKRLSHPNPRNTNNASVAVGGVSGLYLQITPSGGKTWILRTMVGERRREIGLGGYPDVTLAQARERAREAKDAIRRGVDPVEEKRAARASLAAAQKRSLTFADAVDRYMVAKSAELRSEKSRRLWRSSLDAYATPAIGDMLVSSIGVADIQRALAPIWTTKTDTAARLRGRIENVLAWATVAGHRQGDNPARWRGNLEALLPKPGRVGKFGNFPALAINDAPLWFADLRRREGISARAVEFLALTAARSGEVRGMAWGEVDTDARIWTVPAERMKAEREHRVPLTEDMLALLDSLPRHEGSDLVFTAPRGGMLSDMSLSAVMRRMQRAEVEAGRVGWLDSRSGRPAVPHGLRSTFRDWAAEHTENPREMAEIALAHKVGSEVERAYRRGDMLEKRRAMMTAWVGFLRGEDAAKSVRIG